MQLLKNVSLNLSQMLLLLSFIWFLAATKAFQICPQSTNHPRNVAFGSSRVRVKNVLAMSKDDHEITIDDNNILLASNSNSQSRRDILQKTIVIGGSMVAATAAGNTLFVPSASAAVGTLPEFSDTNAILQGLVVNVADQSQQKSMIDFLVQSFDFKVLRQRILDSVEETVRLYL